MIDNHVDGLSISYLTENDLQEMGIVAKGPLLKLRELIKYFQEYFMVIKKKNNLAIYSLIKYYF